MKRQLLSTALPTLELTANEEQAVRDEAWAVIRQAVEMETAFYDHGTRVNPKEWKEVMAKDDLRIYRPRNLRVLRKNSGLERGVSTATSIAMPELFSVRSNDSSGSTRSWLSSFMRTTISHSSSASSEGSQAELADAPPLLCAGYVEGTLEDLSLGAYDGDDVTWKIRSAYMKDKFADARFLATIQRPTYENPFQFLGIKWFTTEYPPVVGAFIHIRDSLVVEAMGIGEDDKGEPFGYYMLHDYQNPRLPELSNFGIIRNKLSFCFISRQISPGRMRMYGRGCMSLGGSLPARLAIMISAISLTSTANLIETAYKKKLVWLVAQQEEERREIEEEQASNTTCHACDKTARLRGLIGCHACGFSFCPKCYVNRKLVVDASESHVTMRTLPFCFVCVLRAKQYPAIDVARATIILKQVD
ncbi:hypothetical protein Poli38472_012570 [Pythium oligandrum]|uniref:FYVE-type domain-containing protein n=1 Tax=Pythium oligandrum TaxID=41045 RepID=A0A8K1FHU2_PYTOL|nr:hypothetical protein Poli38472_012570 [Pythium oligandrum]|eukprot:TMW61379.1 hypothetical protein Poli38472_012570 [Pythium oligandrum]